VTHPHQTPRPGPPGGFRPGPPPGGFRPGPPAAGPPPPSSQHRLGPQQPAQEYRLDASGGTGHPAVDAVLQSLANTATLAPGDQIAEYEAAHQVLQETLASIDR
jgi:hypothetical protein